MAGENSMVSSWGKRAYSLLLMIAMLKICNSFLKEFILDICTRVLWYHMTIKLVVDKLTGHLLFMDN